MRKWEFDGQAPIFGAHGTRAKVTCTPAKPYGKRVSVCGAHGADDL